MATNENSDPRLAVLAAMIVIGAAGMSWWVVRGVLRDGARMNSELASLIAIIAAMILFFFVGRYVLLIVNGEYSAVREIDQTERTERQRIMSAENVASNVIDLEVTREQNRHIEAVMDQETERLRISTDARMHQIGHRIAQLEDGLNAVISRRTNPDSTPVTFVPSRSRPALQAARMFAESLYGSDGLIDPDVAHGSGALKRSVPWKARGGEWNQEPWGNDAQLLLTNEYDNNPPLISPIMSGGSVRGWAINIDVYPTRAHVTSLFAKLV